MNDLQTETKQVKNFLIKSKKKRLQKKQMKKTAIHGAGHTPETAPLRKEVSQIVPVNEDSGSLDGLPVTFLLKLGKQFLPEAEAVRYYYKSSETQYYKNRILLEETLLEGARQLEDTKSNSFWEEVSSQKKA
ncbi:hypothetical protein V1498_17755 [Peribacillus sp. SCS-26]|uniref:hypothetical protein n=1 Tax=Paraperibacillus marinus TaxID=3115295 RepID=UPI0039061C01